MMGFASLSPSYDREMDLQSQLCTPSRFGNAVKLSSEACKAGFANDETE
jgi:hypothetical protein